VGQCGSEDDDGSADDLLLAHVEVGDDESVVDQTDEQGAEHGADDGAASAE
jgi:hypothetical protein